MLYYYSSIFLLSYESSDSAVWSRLIPNISIVGDSCNTLFNKNWSGRQDLNLRSLVSKTSGNSRLSHYLLNSGLTFTGLWGKVVS